MTLYEVIGRAFSESAGGEVRIEQYVAAKSVEEAAAIYSKAFATYEVVRVRRMGAILI